MQLGSLVVAVVSAYDVMPVGFPAQKERKSPKYIT
jgi:hypothetical protein